MELPQIKLNNFKWYYLNEGNCHVVIALEETKNVLKFKKVDINTTKEEINQMIKMTLKYVSFVNNVMIPMLGDNEKIEVYQVSEDDIKQLNESIAPLRPEKRLKKILSIPFCEMSFNYTLINIQSENNWCVEIKPKFGYIDKFLKSKMCFFCMKQKNKLAEGDIMRISNYCPLDLFSGVKIRVYKAIYQLLQNPQNNIKIFQNGKPIYTDTTDYLNLQPIIDKIPYFQSSLCVFINFLVEILLSDQDFTQMPSEIIKMNLINETRTHCDSSKEEMNKCCILKKLLVLQKLSFDFCDKIIIPASDYDYIESTLKIVKLGFQLNKIDGKSEFLSRCSYLEKEMIGAIAKDCSIMISFSSDCEAYSKKIIRICDTNVAYNIAIVDLEPKATSRLKKNKLMYEKFNSIINA